MTKLILPQTYRPGEEPLWLAFMRAITGLTEDSGSGSNPKVLAMADMIARAYPEMSSYCAQYNDDEIAWCGLAAAWCVTMAGVRPPFGSTDTDRFLWAESFASDPNFVHLDEPRLGAIVVKSRDGGNHVTLYEETDGSYYRCRGGNQSNAVNVQSYPISEVFCLAWPRAAISPPERPEAPETPAECVINIKTSADVAVTINHEVETPA